MPPPRRHDPRALGQRHRRLRPSCSRSPRGCSRATTCSTGQAERLRRRRLLRPARRRALPDLRLRPARRRRPRPLRRAQRRGVGGRPRAGAGPRPLHLRRGRAEPAPLVPRHRGAQHGHASTAPTRRRTRARAPRCRAPRRRSSAARPATALDILCGEVRSPVYEAVHRRRVIFVDGALLAHRGRASTGERQPPLRPALPPRAQARPTWPTASPPHVRSRSWRAQRSRSRTAGSPRSTASATPRRSSARWPSGERARFVTLLAPRRRASLELDGDTLRGRRRHDRARRAGDAAMIAPDPAVPRRDALLRPETMAGVDLPAPARRRPGRALRAHVRQVPRRREPARRLPLRRRLRRRPHRRRRDGVAAPEVGAALYPVPPRPQAGAWRRPGRRCSSACSARRHAAPRRLRGRAVRHLRVPRRRPAHVLAYAKVQRDDAEHRGCRALAGRTPSACRACSRAGDGVLLLEALEGRRLDHAAGRAALHGARAPRSRALHARDAAASTLPRLRPRLDLERLVDRRRGHRPRAARRRARGATAARAAARARRGPREPVLLHGDANLRNALLLADGTVALLDLEHLSHRAGRRPTSGRCSPRCSPPARRTAAQALLRGYGEPARPTGRAALAHGRVRCSPAVALPAVSRYRPARSPACASCSTPAPPCSPEGGGGMKPALLFYCQHSVGLGHLMRSLRAVPRSSPSASASCCSRGGELPDGIAPPGDVELVALPPLGVNRGDGFGSGDPRYTTERAWAVRAARASCSTLARAAAAASCSSSCSRSAARSSRASSSRCSNRRARRAPSPPAACATSSSARATTSARTTTARARSPTRTSTPCSCTATRASPAWRRPSSRARRSTSPSTTPASSPAATAAPAARARRAHRRLRRRRARRRAAARAGDGAPPTAARCARSPAR